MRKFLKWFVFFIMSSVLAYADAGDKTIVLAGHLTKSAPVKVTPRELEHSFQVFKGYLYNPWEKKSAHYEGILIDQLVKKYGDKGVQKLRLKAIDDYEIVLEKRMWQTERILLVTKIDGKYIPVKEKGPLRIVFVDYDDSKAKDLHLWMWMIKKIAFE